MYIVQFTPKPHFELLSKSTKIQVELWMTAFLVIISLKLLWSDILER